MPGQALHELDAFLCRHARDNVCWNLDHNGISRRIAALDPRLAAFVQAGHPDLGDVPAVGEFLLGDQEFDKLIEAVSGLPSTLVHEISDQPDRLWLSDATFFHMIPMCTAEVRRHLAAAEAERWSQQSNALVLELTSGRLLLSQGLDTARQLSSLIRKYLVAMGEHTHVPPPLGSFPTSTNPLPSAQSTEDHYDVRTLAAIQRMRKAIRQHERGIYATPSALLKMAGINKQLGRKALRVLKDLGEYRGHGRSKAE